MGMGPSVPETTVRVDSAFGGENYRSALGLLGTLFFMWGFVTVINNTLLPHLRAVFVLSYTQTTLVESVWFIAYFVASLPSSWIIRRLGYQRSIVLGLALMALGAFLMIPSARLLSFELTLTALFVIASGITLLQVAANPFVAVLGPARTASSRLNLVQALNSAGATLAPLFGGYLILGRTTAGTQVEGAVLSASQRVADAQAVQLPYLLVGLVLLALAAVLACATLPVLKKSLDEVKVTDAPPSLWHHKNLVWAIPAIFIYLIAEIGVANLFINFVSQPNIGNLTHEQASRYLFLLWGGMMVGRLGGSIVMRRLPPARVLAAAAGAALVVMLIASFSEGRMAMWALISVGLFHSIMFPTIFTLGIQGLGEQTEAGSGLLVMAIAGGALVVVQGWLADRVGLQHSFLLTAACEVYVLVFAIWGTKPSLPKSDVSESVGRHGHG